MRHRPGAPHSPATSSIATPSMVGGCRSLARPGNRCSVRSSNKRQVGPPALPCRPRTSGRSSLGPLPIRRRSPGRKWFAAHAAALLGLSMLTVGRRIGKGKFPALRPRSKYPTIELAGLVEYLAYRRQFPQGHPNLLRVEAWQRESRQAYRAELDSWRALDYR